VTRLDRIILAATALLLSLGACAGMRLRAGEDPHGGAAPKASKAAKDPRAAAPTPLRVMPLGDSITDGLQVLGGYRSDLWQYMKADGKSVDFVGSRSSGPPQLGDRDDEGHPGWRIHQLTAHARAWMLTYRPDVILLQIGTNDVIQHWALPGAPARLSSLIDVITTTLPSAQVYVATITPLAAKANERRARAYNAAIPRVVAAKAAVGHHVHLVDLHSALTRADLSGDGIHPTNGGYAKMAARWYSALTGAPMNRWEAESPAYATVSNGERLETANASGDGKVGYLSAAGSFLEFALQIPRGGRYRLYVRAGNGSPGPCEQRLTVDGRPDGRLSYPAYGWDRWTITATDVDLNAGRDTVRLTHSTCSAEIDSIGLAPVR
jgi:lysophospholipase L1-like esterase